ncbi:hypothetical protein F4859DRAFT_513464 [Xylaria cf. heliscus]|nr:hypothetical protein F4859DRAFT_513464 [Xylaria cf. heliscus]
MLTGCSEAWYYVTDTPGYVSSDVDHAWIGCMPYEGVSVEIYSPGICPLGQELKQVIKVISVYDDQTTTDIVYDGDFNLGITPHADWTDYDCLSSFEPPVTAYLTVNDGHGFGDTTVLDSPVIARGAYVRIWWNENDLSSFPESLAASLRVGMGLPALPTPSTMIIPTETGPTPTVPTLTIPTLASTDSGRQNSSIHLSHGAIVGIGTGVGATILLIGALGYLALSRRWKRPGHGVEQQDKTSSTRRKISHGWLHRIVRRNKTPLPDLPEMDQGQNIYKYFRGGAWRAELHGTHIDNPDNNTQVDPRHSSAAVIGDTIELEGSVPVVQETVLEAGSEPDHGQQ